MKFLLVWFLAGVFEVPFIKGEQVRWRAGHSYPRPLPQEIMVDAVNYIGLVLLHAHNQNNENNIALSPYGATSVLVALGEGVQGTALNEILQSTLLPLDVSITRVGLRDIHRHLKSYFIPQEGFLAGLTFSHENVTLKSSYEDILRFYGYDVDSFNNALYPDPYSSTTNVGSESTTESLSSVSHAANFSSSTTETTQTTPATITVPSTINTQTAGTTPTTIPAPSTIYTQTAEITPVTVTVPSTIENRDDFNRSESSTIQTTHTDAMGSATVQTTRITTAGSTIVQTTQMSTITSEVIPESTSSSAVTITSPSTTTLTSTPTRTTTTTVTTPTTTVTTPTTTVTTPTTTVTTPTTTQAATITSSQSTATRTITTIAPSTSTVTPQPTTFSSANTAGNTITSSETVSSIQTTAALDTTVQTTTSTRSTTLSTSAPTTIQPTTSTSSTTSAATTPSITTDTTSQVITSSTTSESTKSSITIPVNDATTTTIPLTTTITQSTRPTAVTISAMASTVGVDNDGSSTASSTTITTPAIQIQSTGPIVINLQPTTFASTNTANTVTDSTATTESESTITTISTTDTISTGSTSTNADTPSTTIISSTLNPQSTTLNSNSDPTPFTVDLVPSTIGTGSTPSSSTTGNPIPTLITPVGDLPDGFKIDVRPSTIAPSRADIAMAENGKNRRMVTSQVPKRNSLPRFRDDVELIKALQTENNSAGMHKVGERSFISDSSTSKNSFSDKQNPAVENKTIFKNMKDIIIDASIETSITDFTTASTLDFIANITDNSTNDSDSSLYTKSSSTTEMNSAITDYYDKDVNTDTDLSDAEIVLSEEEMLSEENLEKRSISTESAKGKENTRGTRSVIDYLIARYHDNNNPSNIHMSTGTEYEPEKPTTFAVNGKLRESNISFMTYDTVLPFRYISYLNALALTFPLDSTKYYLLLILPLDEMGIDNLIANMMSTTLKQIIYHLQPTRVKATIPSFMVKGYVVLTPTLQKLGIRQIFEPRHADFSRMTDDKDIYVTNIEQAVTVTIRNYVDPSTLQNNQHFRRRGPVQFTADHPFLYFVMDSEIHVALMAGKIINPLNSRIR